MREAMKNIDAAQLQQMQRSNGDFLLINTLDEEHFENTRIPGAINIPQSQPDFVDRVRSQADSPDQKIVTYCASSQCNSSTQAAEKLEAAGFTNVYDFEAGAQGWQAAGEKIAAN